MNRAAMLVALALGACAPPPKPAEKPRPDPAAEAWYAPAAEQLAGMARDADAAFRRGRTQEAARIVTGGQPLLNRLIAVPRPTLAAMEAASDLDDLYGRMLLGDRRYGWARLQFQKNAVRWKHWSPKSEDTARRLQEAEARLAECDRLIAAQ